MLNILLSLWGLVTDWIAGVLQWLRRPGAWIKACAAVMTLVFTLSAFVAYDQHVKLEERNRQFLACKADVQGLETELATWETRINEIRLEMEAADAERERQVAAARAVGVQLESELEQARLDSQLFQKRYADRPLECSAALELLDTTCKNLEGY